MYVVLPHIFLIVRLSTSQDCSIVRIKLMLKVCNLELIENEHDFLINVSTLEIALEANSLLALPRFWHIQYLRHTLL